MLCNAGYGEITAERTESRNVRGTVTGMSMCSVIDR